MSFRSSCFQVLLIVLVVFAISPTSAQQDNSAFYRRFPVEQGQARDLRIGLRAFGFVKNNEYFNKIADGYTLFGYHLNPNVSYHPSEHVRIEGGVFLWKDFGNPRLQQVRPTFTIGYEKGNHSLYFGTLPGNLNHGYIEPLWDFERIMQQPLQNGLQYRFNNGRTNLNLWVDWLVMQYPHDTQQEELAGGFTGSFLLKQKVHIEPVPHTTVELETKDYQVLLPVQLTAKHRGGQLDVNEQPLVTLLNGATGFEAYKYLKTRGGAHRPFLRSLYTKNYIVGFLDHSNEKQLPYRRGYGLYFNAGADTRYLNAMLSYWRGNGYISEFGGKLYQSVSTTVHNPGYTEKQRELLILRLMKDVPLANGLALSARLEPHYDFNLKSVEFSAGLYLNFNSDFFITKLKHTAHE